jgi:hypothetical protein
MGTFLLERAFGERIFKNGNCFEFKPHLKTQPQGWQEGGERLCSDIFLRGGIPSPTQVSPKGPKELDEGPVYFWNCWFGPAGASTTQQAR